MRITTLKTGMKCGLLTVLMVLALAAVAQGYTVVLLDGRQIEIGNNFAVTPTALTYEVTPGMQVTVLMASIDIASTERFNNEAPGSLLGRMNQRSALVQAAEGPTSHVAPRAARSVSNHDLERFARVRRDSEVAYEQRLKDLGQPSMAVLREQNAAEDERLWKELEQKRVEAEEMARTAKLQEQIAELSAHIRSLQEKAAEQSPFPTETFSGYNIFPGYNVFPGYDVFPIYGRYPGYGRYPRYQGYPGYGNYPSYGGFPYYGSYARSRVNPNIFRTPYGLPIGGAFGSFNVPVDNRPRLYGRQNTFVPRGTQLRGNRVGGRPSWHGRRR